MNGDGCDDTCTIEFGWSCSGGSASGPDTCIEICGDGYDLGEYGCDDGKRYGRGAFCRSVKVSYRDWETDRKSTRLNSSHITRSRMPSSA